MSDHLKGQYTECRVVPRRLDLHADPAHEANVIDTSGLHDIVDGASSKVSQISLEMRIPRDSH